MAQSNQGGKVKLPSTHLVGATKLTVMKMPGSPLSHTHEYTHTQFPSFLESYGKVWRTLKKVLYACQRYMARTFPALWNMGPGCKWRRRKRKLHRPPEYCKCPFTAPHSPLWILLQKKQAPYSSFLVQSVLSYTWNLISTFLPCLFPVWPIILG